MKTALIINALRSSSDFAFELNKRGWTCLHAWTSKDHYADNFKLFDPRPYAGCIFLDEENNLKPDLIIGADDTGNYDACRLTGSSAILDRYDITRKLNEECSTTSLNGRMVVKPRLSKGGYDRLNFGENLSIPTGFFAQREYDGHEYAVDVVSQNGVHALCAVWKYEKVPGHFTKTRMDLLRCIENKELINKIFSYARHVIDTAEYAFGASHIEVIDTNHGMRLIEANFRLHGTTDFRAIKKAVNYTQPELLADAAEGKLVGRDFYDTSSFVRKIYVTNKTARCSSEINWQELDKMPGVTRVYRGYADHEFIPAGGVTYRDIMAIIVLQADSKEEMDAREKGVRNHFEVKHEKH